MSKKIKSEEEIAKLEVARLEKELERAYEIIDGWRILYQQQKDMLKGYQKLIEPPVEGENDET